MVKRGSAVGADEQWWSRIYDAVHHATSSLCQCWHSRQVGFSERQRNNRNRTDPPNRSMREPIRRVESFWFIGIDPGFMGAIAIIDLYSLAHVYDTPTLTILAKGRKAKTRRAYDMRSIVQ